jgi:Plasmid pRiA4b ORF-3-like protein
MNPGTSHAHGAPRRVTQLHISLIDSDPLIWRRLLVPAAIRLDKLHRVFQDAMGWTDSHLHMCRMDDDVLYTSYDHDLLQGELDERMSTLEQALGDRTRFMYDYDFGDNWEHDVIIEEKTDTRLGLKYPVCVDGQNACPPRKTAAASAATNGSGKHSPTRPTTNTSTTQSGLVARSIPNALTSRP